VTTKNSVYESKSRAFPMHQLSVRPDNEQELDLKSLLKAHQEGVEPTFNGMTLSRELVLHLIEVLKKV